MKKLVATLCLCSLTLVGVLKAQDTLPDNKTVKFTDMNLAQLMSMEISVASVTKLTPRESPGIVSIITSDEIKNSGASHLTEILAMVPGFDLAMDVEGAVGIGIRGNWAHEGKVLMLIDGQEMNEELYSTLPMGLHYPVENIERIEIIRGPGSSIYGGTAAYAVINIVSKSAETFKGISVSATTSIFANAKAYRGADIYAGNRNKNFSYSINAHTGSGNRSNKNYTDAYGNTYDMGEFSQIQNQYVNVGVDIKKYCIRALFNDYTVHTRDGYQQILSQSYPSSFKSWYAELKRKYTVSKNFSITPLINYKYQTPWMYEGESTEDEFSAFRIDIKKFTASLLADYEVSDIINILCGAEYFNEMAIQKSGELFYSNNATELSLKNYSFFAQSLIKTNPLNITAGFRYTQNSMYGSSFVPRMGITRAWQKFHFKALLSKSFRAPGIQNMDLNPDIRPENSTVAEIETGLQLSQNIAITINGYDITTKQPIVYFYNEEQDLDGYLNGTRSGTRGFEIEFKSKSNWGYSGCNYSYYSTASKNVISNYEVPFNHSMVLAFPAHKASLFADINITRKINIYSSLNFKGPRYGIVAYDEETEEITYAKFNPAYIFNLMLNFNSVLFKKFSISTGIKNLLDDDEKIIQPYNDLHAPLPGRGREFVVKATYDIPLK